MNEQSTTQACESVFYQDFAAQAGIMALFSCLRISSDPMAEFDRVFDYWLDQKRDNVKMVIDRAMEINGNPENFSLDELYMYGNIEPEDYDRLSKKALSNIKTIIKEEFGKFLKK